MSFLCDYLLLCPSVPDPSVRYKSFETGDSFRSKGSSFIVVNLPLTSTYGVTNMLVTNVDGGGLLRRPGTQHGALDGDSRDIWVGGFLNLSIFKRYVQSTAQVGTAQVRIVQGTAHGGQVGTGHVGTAQVDIPQVGIP